MTLYYSDSTEMRRLLASLASLVALKIRKKVLNTLRNSDRISITFRGALNKGIDRLDIYINKLTDIVDGYRRDDPALYAFVLKDLLNNNYNNHLFGEDKMVVNNIFHRSDNMSTSTVSTANNSVNSTISTDLNSRDPITQVAVSLTFDGNQTDNGYYYKYGFAFGNVPYYGSKTTFTLDNENNITILSDGDPYPAKCGTPQFTNNGTTPRQFGSKQLIEQWYNVTFPYLGGVTNPDVNSVDACGNTYQLEAVGILINGVKIGGQSLGYGTRGYPFSYNSENTGGYPVGYYIPNTDLNTFDKNLANAATLDFISGLDPAGGHISPSGLILNGSTGQYHIHDAEFASPTNTAWNNSTFIQSSSYISGTNYNGDYLRNSDGHSKIFGMCFDGYPIYGPYGYVSAYDSTSGTTVMVSSYQLKSSPFQGRGYTYTDTFNYMSNGSLVSSPVFAGVFISDYEYIEGLGTLDTHNGRYCVTPEYPNGTYAYFMTVDSEGESTFPYVIGLTTLNTLHRPNIDQSITENT